MKKPSSLAVLALGTGLAVVACSGSSTGVDPSGSSGSSGSSGEGSSGSSGEGSSGSSGTSGSSGSSGDPDASVVPHETKVGTITIVSNKYSIGTTSVELGTATGSFYRLPPIAGSVGTPCTTATQGACELTTCTFSGATTDAGTVPVIYTSSGTATVSGVLVNDGSMTLTPGAYGYQTVSGNVAFFTGGETVRVRAPGLPSGAPAFDLTQTAPSGVTVTSPTFNAQARVVVGSGQALNVAWAGGSASDVVVQMAAGTTAKSAQARCAFPSASGHGTVPATILTAVSSVGGSGTSFIVSSTARKVSTVDGWTLTVDLQAYGLKPAGAGLATGLVVVE